MTPRLGEGKEDGNEPASHPVWAPVTPLPGHSKYRVDLLLKSIVSECAPTTVCACVGCICMCTMCLREYMYRVYMHVYMLIHWHVLICLGVYMCSM